MPEPPAYPGNIRLAFRVEGEMWNAYAAPRDSMEGAFLLGSIHARAVENEQRKNSFMALMVDALGDAVRSVTGEPDG